MHDTEDVLVDRIAWHDHELVFKRSGDGEPLVLIHGIAGSFDTWDPVLPALGANHDTIAPDLPGHGRAPKPRGDYSLGAFATAVRDLLGALDVPSATIVGHSLGGGIALQLVYQYPELCNRLVLVSSGGLGPEVSPILRAATLPGSDLFLRMATSDRVENTARAVFGKLGDWGLRGSPTLNSMAQHMLALKDAESRRAFVTTARSVMDVRGQRIDATDRLYLADELPLLIVWGRRDRLIPVAHAQRAHELVPNSRLEIFERCGHFPHEEHPERFVEVLEGFLATTEPANLNLKDMTGKALRRSTGG